MIVARKHRARWAGVAAAVAMVVILSLASPCNSRLCSQCEECFACDTLLGDCFNELVEPKPSVCGACSFCSLCFFCDTTGLLCGHTPSLGGAVLLLSVKPTRVRLVVTAAAWSGFVAVKAGFLASVDAVRAWQFRRSHPDAAQETVFDIRIPRPTDRECDEDATCVIAIITPVGRTGNSLIQLFNALELVYKCGGVISAKKFHQSSLIVPEVLNPRNYGETELRHVLKTCRKLRMEADSFFHRFNVSRCACHAVAFESVAIERLLSNLRSDILGLDVSGATVAHFRAGDVFSLLSFRLVRSAAVFLLRNGD